MCLQALHSRLHCLLSCKQVASNAFWRRRRQRQGQLRRWPRRRPSAITAWTRARRHNMQMIVKACAAAFEEKSTSIPCSNVVVRKRPRGTYPTTQFPSSRLIGFLILAKFSAAVSLNCCASLSPAFLLFSASNPALKCIGRTDGETIHKGRPQNFRDFYPLPLVG